MNMYISTNVFDTQNFKKVFKIIDDISSNDIGVEIFPLWHEDGFETTLKSCINRLKDLPVSIHGPYYFTEHSAKRGTKEYDFALEYFKKTLNYAEELKSKYIVFHHNNCLVNPENKSELIKYSTENLNELNELALKQGIEIVVENAGVLDRQNMLFDETEFIDMCLSIENKVLIDIGHAFCNGWDLKKLMTSLKEKTVSYHLHNNFGIKDEHNRIFNGDLNIVEFLQDFKKYTPQADLVVEYSARLCDDEDGIKDDINFLKNQFVL